MTNNNAKFNGKTKALEGHVYNVGVPNQGHLFANTTKEISKYAGQKKILGHLPGDQEGGRSYLHHSGKQVTGSSLDTTAVKIIYKNELDGFIKRESTYQQNKLSMYAIVFGQYSEPMRAKIESNSRFNTVKQASNAVVLLKLIR